MPLLTIILPFFNEEGWIGTTIDSLAAQSDQRFRLLLIDNGSTDSGTAEAAIHAAPLGQRATILPCPTPGKIHAMAMGLSWVDTPLVAICDADTHYPPDYVKRVIALFDSDPRAAAVMAIDLYAPQDTADSQQRIAFILRKSRRFAAKCHAGGYAQAFRASALRAAGGFDATRWPYVLEDHEIVHRVMAHGRTVYHPGHVCFPSDRRASRKAVSWTRGERLLYRYAPRAAMNWYFYRFLGRRLAARNSLGIALRRKDWSSTIA
ncbi:MULTISPECIES: glycosyltransferase [unclassified Sphingobium]|uniref:glycosyltransferase n=1 Tax=unclassified Sphingobium TaxID=2611147 RepID=UPI0007703B62|nr:MULTISPECIES: glycosyltransferase family 2 protein [unclassified Sphingobium]AMK22374.1 glycosyl transferase family protein [Sphingobium sp. TKS]NML90076.1 glycosyltransferase family 2 protein [Sphingobium sp. TB-6]